MTATNVTLDRLIDAIQMSWGSDTTTDPENWTQENPSYGQCAVTSLIVQHFFGGSLVRTVVEGVSHYYNELPDGTELDLTRQQFPQWLPQGAEYRDREYVIGFPITQARYEILMERVQKVLVA